MAGWEESEAPESVLLDIAGCAHLFGGEGQMARRIAADLRRAGLTPRVAVADTIGAAWAVAGALGQGKSKKAKGKSERHSELLPFAFCLLPSVAVVPAGRQAEALSPLPVDALRIPADVVEVLDDLGIQTIGQLSALPRQTLPSRFGSRILKRLDQALGHLPEQLIALQPQEPVQASWGCEPPIEGRPAVEAVVRRLLVRVIRRLQPRNEGILQLEVELSALGNETARFSIGLVRPSLKKKRLLELARLQLERVRLREKIADVALHVTRTAPLDIEQATLFDTGGRQRTRRDLDSLLDRLSNRLGEDAVLRPKLCPDFQPERAVEYRKSIEQETFSRPRRGAKSERSEECKNLNSGPSAAPLRAAASDPATRALPQRPLRLFPKPLPVSVWSVVPDGPPIRLRGPDGEQAIVRCDGPEKIETGWWRPLPCRREYFRADTENGRCLWLFHSPTDGWFIHGEF